MSELVAWLPPRSGCEKSTPVSMIPTTTELEPVATSHASGASMSASAIPLAPLTACPVLWRPQSCEKDGSFGVASALTR